MRATALCLLVIPCLGSADRLVTVPMSLKVPRGQFRVGSLTDFGDRRSEFWLGLGLSRALECELSWGEPGGRRSRLTGSVAYQVVPSMEDTSPGLAVGIQDFAGSTRRGRTVYAAITYKMSNTGLQNDGTSTDLTLGLWSYDRGLVYVGTKLPLSDSFWLIGEHDGLDLNWGAHLAVGSGSSVRFLFMKGQPTLGLSLITEF